MKSPTPRSNLLFVLATAVVFTAATGLVGCGDAAEEEESDEDLRLTEHTDDLMVTCEPADAPLQSGDNDFEICVSDHEGGPVEVDALDVEPWMDAHGHGSPEETTIEELEDGCFEAGVYFNMPGEWTLRVDIEQPDADTERVEFVYDVQ